VGLPNPLFLNPKETGAKADHQAAIDAADQYFKNLSLGGSTSGDILTSPDDTHPMTGYFVNQNTPQQIYQPQVRAGSGDLLI